MKIAIIPARGGSKRIPRKNIKEFLGKPLIAYSIEAAIQSRCFDKVIVSTDDAEIAEIARRYNAIVPFIRPPELSDDITPTAPVVLHAINEIEKSGIVLDSVCCIYPTAPFLKASYLKEGLAKLQSSNATTVLSVTSYAFPILRSLNLSDSGIVSMNWPEHQLSRSQDLPDSYHDAGQFYWLNAKKFKNTRSLYSKDSEAVILPRRLVQDIDTTEDWDFALALFKALKLLEGK